MSSKGRLSDAVWTAFTEALRFVVVPYVLVDLVRRSWTTSSSTSSSSAG
ncbi:MAG: hypothetical protein MUE55_04900 [Thermoplasmata archaeon]|nr:hypothetical protein [Thermoplasmata archaeon]